MTRWIDELAKDEKSSLSTEQAKELLARSHTFEMALGCVARESTLPHAVARVGDLLGAISAAATDRGVATELENNAREVGAKLIDRKIGEACTTLSDLAAVAARPLTPAQAMSLATPIADIRSLVRC